MLYTEEQKRLARIELAKREIARRAQLKNPKSAQKEEIPYTPPPPRTGWGGIGEDVMDIPGNLLDYAMNLPGEAIKSSGQIHHKPGRALMNVIAGTGEAAEAPFNLLGSIGPYFKEKKIPYLGAIPGFHIPDVGIEKLMGLDKEEEGDKFLRELPALYAGAKMFKLFPGVKQVGERIKGQRNYKPLKNELAALEERHGEVAKEHGEATKEHEKAESEFNALKEFLETQPGFESGKPSALIRKAREAKQNIESLKEHSETYPEHLRATEVPISPEKTPLSIVEPEKPELTSLQVIPKTHVSDAQLKKAEDLLKTHEQKSSEHEAGISEHLGEGFAHRKRVAQKLNPILEARQNEIGEGFNKYIADLKGKEVTLSNAREAKDVMEDIHKAISESGHESDAVNKLSQELHDIEQGKADTVPADKFVSAYRTLQQEANKLRNSAYGKSPDEFTRLTKKADELDAQVSKMEIIIDNGLGGKNLEDLNKLKHRYATEVAPLFKNKFYQYMRANSKAPTNMIEQLTNEPYIRSTNPNKITGTQILNDIIKNDPELLKHVVGERYAHKPHALHAWDEAAHEFIQHMPELQGLRKSHFESLQNETRAKSDLEQARNEHRMQKEEAAQKDMEKKEEARERNARAKEEAAEKTRKKKEEVHKENLRREEEHKQKTKYYKTQQEIKSLEERHARLTEQAKKMQEKAQRKNISLKEKLEVEAEMSRIKKEMSRVKKELDKLEKDRKKLWNTAKTIGGAAVTLSLGVPAYKKAKSMIGLGD